jgi:small subunit ribosomal protein S9
MAAARHLATGKRKNAVAKVYLEPGEGKITINGKAVQDYFTREGWRAVIQQPFVVTETTGRYNAVATLFGGGLSGQAGALRHGIARALLQLSPPLRERLRREGLLTRDPRVKERKKYGQTGARKRFQYSKR